MISDFWVKNYLSIRDKQELSFLAKGALFGTCYRGCRRGILVQARNPIWF